MLDTTRKVLWRWQTICLLLLVSGLFGFISEWQDSTTSTIHRVKPAQIVVLETPAYADRLPWRSNSFHSLAGYPTGPNGPLEPEHRKQIRLAKEARERTRALVNSDRTNIDCAAMKCIALTYDDGPEPDLTVQLLDILKRRQAVATFFVVGTRAAAQPAILKQAVQDRNQIGNHTWSHRNLKTLTDPEIIEEIHHTDEAIVAAIGQSPLFVRPPMGEFDDRVVAATQRPIAMWAVDPRDWHDRDTATIYQRVIEAAGQDRIILMHDMYPSTIQASAFIIDELQRQGYVLVTMSEMLGITEVSAPAFNGHIFRYR